MYSIRRRQEAGGWTHGAGGRGMRQEAEA